MKNNELNIFIDEAKRIICSRFFHDTNGKFISTVYPVIFDNVTVDNMLSDEKSLDLLDYLGQQYERIVSKIHRKDYGQFYTRNSKIIDLMIDEIDIYSGKILEPSCGSGLFLVNIADRIIRNFVDEGQSNENILNYLVNNIYANDIQDEALMITEINLISHIYNILVNAVNENSSFKMKRFNISNFDFVESKDFKDFSIVIGNPPFVTLYGKRSRNMNEEKRAFYNTFDFVLNKKGNNKFNLSMFFIENGLKALKHNGTLLFIQDISFFETAYIDLRKYILYKYNISFICTGLSEFDNVASGQIIVKIDNNTNNSLVKWLDYSTNESFEINQDQWRLDKPKYRFRKPLVEFDSSINEKVKKYNRLDFYFPAKELRTCCALTGKTEEFIVDSLDDFPIVYPYIEGSKGLTEKFGFLYHQRLIKYDYDLQIKLSDEFKIQLEKLGVKNKKRVTLGDNEVYDSPKLFIRQSASELIATYTEKKYAANNSIYVLSKKDNNKSSTDLLKFICGIINSNLMTYFALINNIIRCEKGKTPQIKTSDLKEIRIPYEHPYRDRIIHLVEQLQKTPSANELLNELNKLVYEMFEIDKEEILYIENKLLK